MKVKQIIIYNLLALKVNKGKGKYIYMCYAHIYNYIYVFFRKEEGVEASRDSIKRPHPPDTHSLAFCVLDLWLVFDPLCSLSLSFLGLSSSPSFLTRFQFLLSFSTLRFVYFFQFFYLCRLSFASNSLPKTVLPLVSDLLDWWHSTCILDQCYPFSHP